MFTGKILTPEEVSQIDDNNQKYIEGQKQLLNPSDCLLIDELKKLGFKEFVYHLSAPIEYRLNLGDYPKGTDEVCFIEVCWWDGTMTVCLVNHLDLDDERHIATNAKTLEGIKQLYKLVTGRDLSEVNNA